MHYQPLFSGPLTHRALLCLHKSAQETYTRSFSPQMNHLLVKIQLKKRKQSFKDLIVLYGIMWTNKIDKNF